MEIIGDLEVRLHEKHLKEYFSNNAIVRAKEYLIQGRVKKIDIDEISGDYYITSTVRGSKLYKQEISISADELIIDGDCTCPVSYNCKHVAAVLFAIINDAKNKQKTAYVMEKTLRHDVALWLKQVQTVLNKPTVPESHAPAQEYLLYILNINKYSTSILFNIDFQVARWLKKGGYGVPKTIQFHQLYGKKYVLPEDEEILIRLELLRRHSRNFANNMSDELMEKLLATNRCYYEKFDGQPLKLANDCEASIDWFAENNGNQRLDCRFSEPDRLILPLKNLWYVDKKTFTCGRVKTNIAPPLANILLTAPSISPHEAELLQANLSKQLPQLPLPKTFHIIKENIAPKPHLHLSGLTLPTPVFFPREDIILPVAQLSFIYGGNEIKFGRPESIISYLNDNQLIEVKRQWELERKYRDKLYEYGLHPVSKFDGLLLPHNINEIYFSFSAEKDISQMSLYFCYHEVPKLSTAGWKITIDESYPYRLYENDDAWYSRIEESGYDWFNVELGIKIGEKTINILPLLLNTLNKLNASHGDINKLSDEGKFFIKLPDNEGMLPVSVKRIRDIINIFTELYDDKSLSETGKLKLHRLQAAQLATLENQFDKPLHWLGGEKLLEIGRRLRNFTGIKPVAAPANFGAELRPYQREGLSWLQFLRENDLAGILADDMGLGKTVQALAHILTEKNAGRLTNPCLVIAPTSLMPNWYWEVQRFTKDIKALVLHGKERKSQFETLNEFDVILTTYPLLLRDKTILLAQKFYLLILDEAQIIKNPKAQATILVQQLNAQHRLCLTGTPLENHLGELWSLYNFLLPGLLGDSKQFTRLFRTPIEKQNNNARRLALMQRVAPFLLRRNKQTVAKELPPKTEILRVIELEDKQRDLYESIRLAMHEKVKQAITSQGLAKSHILILDALLKLRQVCCDPRLLKLNNVKKIHASSAKLKYLCEMLPKLIDEGRRILLFSQFTEMLALIEHEIIKLNINYVKLTGTTKERAEPIQKFQTGKVPLFLLSLKAGGVGLNLTAADTVIHYDPWWNPAVENQATDRAYRIGQDKTVFVYKLISHGTVEEKILTMQQEKQALLDSLFSEQTNTKINLSADDLQMLFQPLEQE